jgi:ketosteroid isomerase-like protein
MDKETSQMDAQPTLNSDGTNPIECMRRIQHAINTHDLEALTACFEPDYQSTFPVHPDRAFGGHGPMRRNWTQIFAGVPDIQASLVRVISEGDNVWAEWEWTGSRRDGGPFLMRGVTIQGVREGRVKWTRLYMEPVEVSGNDAFAAVQQSVTGGMPVGGPGSGNQA